MTAPEAGTVTSDPSRNQGSPHDEFPFYNGQPVNISVGQWVFLLVMVVAGFLVLTARVLFFAEKYGQFIPAILYFALPLAGLVIVAPDHWTAIFRKVGFREILWMFAFAVLTLALSSAVGIIITQIHGANANPAVGALAEATMETRVLFFAKTIPQLFGEELMTIIPFLAIMNFFCTRKKTSRKKSILIAWVFSAILFGLAHLPTYNWDFLQCIFIIGTARMSLTLAYLKTKNIWVSYGAHVINDWAIFGISILGATLPKS